MTEEKIVTLNLTERQAEFLSDLVDDKLYQLNNISSKIEEEILQPYKKELIDLSEKFLLENKGVDYYSVLTRVLMSLVNANVGQDINTYGESVNLYDYIGENLGLENTSEIIGLLNKYFTDIKKCKL